MFQFGGNSTIGNTAQQQQKNTGFAPLQTQQQQQVNAGPTLERLTRVSDLPSDAQLLIEQLNQHILQQGSISDQLALNKETLQTDVDSVSTDVDEILRRYARAHAALQIDQNNLQRCRDQVQELNENIRRSTISVDGLTRGNSNARGDYLFVYFHDTITRLEQDLHAYAKIVASLEDHVNSARAQNSPQNAAALLDTVKQVHAAFMSISSKVAQANERLQTLS